MVKVIQHDLEQYSSISPVDSSGWKISENTKGIQQTEAIAGVTVSLMKNPIERTTHWKRTRSEKQ